MTRKTALVALEEIFHDQDFSATQAVIVAVSGGGDSMALLLLVKAWLERINNPPRLIGVSVDHGLRPQSRAEAHSVADFCAERAIAHEIACWQGVKPRTGLMAQARLARYQLLYESACRHQASVIVTGHTLDDLAETYLMRAARLSPVQQEWQTMPRGLAAMARQSLLFGDIRLLRPLLGVRRATLRQFLQQHAIRWIEDPSNEDARFERVRVRQNINEPTLVGAVKAAKKAAICRKRYHEQALEFLQKNPSRSLGEGVQFDLDSLSPRHVFLPQLLADCACLVGGSPYLRPAPASFLTWLQNVINKDADGCFTWAGSLIEKRGTKWRLWRERRNLPTLTLTAHEHAVWDGRYLITNNSAKTITIRPATRDEVTQEAQKLSLPTRYFLATPAIIAQDKIVLPRLNPAFIHHGKMTFKRILAPFEFLYPEEEGELIAHWRHVFAFTPLKNLPDTLAKLNMSLML